MWENAVAKGILAESFTYQCHRWCLCSSPNAAHGMDRAARGTQGECSFYMTRPWSRVVYVCIAVREREAVFAQDEISLPLPTRFALWFLALHSAAVEVGHHRSSCTSLMLQRSYIVLNSLSFAECLVRYGAIHKQIFITHLEWEVGCSHKCRLAACEHGGRYSFLAATLSIIIIIIHGYRRKAFLCSKLSQCVWWSNQTYTLPILCPTAILSLWWGMMNAECTRIKTWNVFFTKKFDYNTI